MSADSGRQLFALADIKRFWVLIAAAAAAAAAAKCSFGEHKSEKKFSNPDLKFPPKREKTGSLFLKLSRKKNFRCKRVSVRKFCESPKTSSKDNRELWILDRFGKKAKQNKTGPVMTNEGRQKDWKWKRK